MNNSNLILTKADKENMIVALENVYTNMENTLNDTNVLSKEPTKKLTRTLHELLTT